MTTLHPFQTSQVFERQLYSAGFFLVEPAPRPRHSDNSLLPEFVISISSHICELHPPIALLSWVNHPEFFVDGYRQKLGLNSGNFLEAITRIDDLFEKRRFGWDSIFYERETALDFFNKFLRNVAHVKLLQAFIPVIFSSDLSREAGDDSSYAHGIELSLHRSNVVSRRDSDFIGYEIVCHNIYLGHSFLCNSLEKIFFEKLNIRLNQYGLISSFEDAIRASAFCNSEESGAEPGYWLPCGLLELPLPKPEVNADA